MIMVENCGEIYFMMIESGKMSIVPLCHYLCNSQHFAPFAPLCPTLPHLVSHRLPTFYLLLYYTTIVYDKVIVGYIHSVNGFYVMLPFVFVAELT